MTRSLSYLALCFLLCPGSHASDGGSTPLPRGSLFIIGGGNRTRELMSHYLELAGGTGAARIVVLPNASSEPETSGADLASEFRSLGAASAEYVYVRRTDSTMGDAVRRVEGATGIYFSGGDQSRITRDLLDTPLHAAVLRRYREGAVVGGTSAGAAVMSEVMITGEERINRDSSNAFPFIRRGNVITTRGFGLVQNAIIDQHFIRRKRHNRLLNIVLENPALLGAGIDESTALVVKPDGTWLVVGERTVMVVDARKASSPRSDARGNLAATGMTLSLLADGDRFDPVRGAMIPDEGLSR